MKLSTILGSLALTVIVTGPIQAAPAGSPDGGVSAATKAKWQRLAAAYDLEARFYRAAGKPAAAFLARRAATLGESYRRRALTGPEAGN